LQNSACNLNWWEISESRKHSDLYAEFICREAFCSNAEFVANSAAVNSLATEGFPLKVCNVFCTKDPMRHSGLSLCLPCSQFPSLLFPFLVLSLSLCLSRFYTGNINHCWRRYDGYNLQNTIVNKKEQLKKPYGILCNFKCTWFFTIR